MFENDVSSLEYFVIDAGEEDVATVERIFKGLASQPRLNILRSLHRNARSIHELADLLGMPTTTVVMHINTLEGAGLVRTELQPAKHGRQRICSRIHYDRLLIYLPRAHKLPTRPVDVSMPVGAYTECQVVPTCGLATANVIIGEVDRVNEFYDPARINAQLLWFKQGYVEYCFPNNLIKHAIPQSIQFSMEICSEAPTHADDWPSDITLWVNGIEIGTWTSPADFGKDRGLLTPKWWGEGSSQFGLLKMWRITTRGSYVDGSSISDVSLDDLQLSSQPYISMRIGIKEDALHVGGLNIFGREFGNYPQDIVMRVTYAEVENQLIELNEKSS